MSRSTKFRTVRPKQILIDVCESLIVLKKTVKSTITVTGLVPAAFLNYIANARYEKLKYWV